MARKPVRQVRTKKDDCEGKECYLSIDHTDTYTYSYAEVGQGQQCSEPSDAQRASAVRQAQRRFEVFAQEYCKADGYGDEQCKSPCKCKPAISKWQSKNKGWRQQGTKCVIEIEASAHIDCRCKRP